MKILLINGHQKYEGISKGELNKTILEAAKELLTQKSCEVKTTVVDSGYEPKEEIEKFQWADTIIFISPVFFMDIPYGFKKYIDEVYMSAYGVFFEDDGRKKGGKYGTGGKLQDKKYMLVTTWNAPAAAFNDKEQFFEGKSADDVFFSFHKGQQFLGMKPLQSFSFHDVILAPNVESDLERFKKHLAEVFRL